MDPLSIAASAAGLATGCTQIVTTLYTWIDDTIAVDENVAGLCNEVKALGRVLESISNASTSALRPVMAEIDPDGSLWAVVMATLGDIDNTLTKLDQILNDVQKSSGVFSRSFLRRPTKQIKFSFRSKEIAMHKDRVQSYNTAMTSALQMINVCLMIHNNSSQDAVFNLLGGIKSQIGRVETALHQGTQPHSGPTGSSRDADGSQITRNLRQFVRVAETFYSNASAITREGPRSTVWGGSVLGDPLTGEQLSYIENWIPPPSNSKDKTASTSSVSDPQYHSNSDDDIDKDLLKRLRELAIESRQKGDYAKAEKFYRKVINRSEAGESNHDPHDLVQDRIDLAYACLHQRKWAEAEAIILPMAMERKLADIAVYIGLHALALAHTQSSEFAKADRCCKRALWGKRKILGKEDPSCWETLALLSRICEAQGETEEAEAHRSFIPASYRPVLHVDPLVYLGEYDKKEPQPPVLQTPSSSTILVSLSQALIVGVHVGTEQTAVSFALATSLAAGEMVVNVWPAGREGTKVESTVPSVLYYGPAEPTPTVVGWGYDTADALAPTGYPKPGVYKLEWFMLGLMNSQQTHMRYIPPPPAGKSYEDVVTDYLSKLRDAICIILRSSFDMEEIHVLWWFAIPSVWDNIGEASLRASALQAGFVRDNYDDRVVFVPESMAYLLRCYKTLRFNPQPSDAFLVVVAGKATVELVTYEVTSEFPLCLKQLTTPSSDGSCGLTALNRNFSELLRERIKILKLPEGSRIAGRTYAKGILDFESRIKHAFSDDGSTWAVKVGLFADYPDAGIDRESGCMAVTNDAMLSCYKPVVDRVTELISDQLASAAEYHPRTRVKAILLTGEFCMSPYLVKQVKLLVRAALDVSVVTPSDILTDIARGAVRAGVLHANRLLRVEYLPPKAPTRSTGPV